MIEFLVYALVGLLTVGIPVLYIRHERRKSKRAHSTLERNIKLGLDEPVSLHPIINPDKCIGTGACVKACPEYDILGLISNRGELINPNHCIGHGMCQASCPVDAIDLVFGTLKRGVDIPALKGTFETNVTGVYIAGELGGMGLIRNAITQGRQAVEAIAESLNGSSNEKDGYDLVVIGAGPAGLSAILQAKKMGLNAIAVDQDEPGGTVLSYPRKKLVMTQPFELPMHGVVKRHEMFKEELVELFAETIEKSGVTVKTGEQVLSASREGKSFLVKTSVEEYRAKRLLLAIGRRGSPRKLGAKGEKSAKVAYRLPDPEHYSGMQILIVGGGDSAVEAAVSLSEQPGNTVHLSYRRDSIFRIKVDNVKRLDEAIAAGRIKKLYNTEVTGIEKEIVHLKQNDNEISVDNDQVFVMIGGQLPTELLDGIGIEIKRMHGEKA